ncbi:MAG TPA: hypothetical protein DCY88_26630 [Cyanobacteria bacterium UBA11372]|nr:hypothetical protein [Cyanobacteria bacterium UBA11372]
MSGGASEQVSGGASEQVSRGAGEQVSRGESEQVSGGASENIDSNSPLPLCPPAHRHTCEFSSVRGRYLGIFRGRC